MSLACFTDTWRELYLNKIINIIIDVFINSAFGNQVTGVNDEMAYRKYFKSFVW